MLAALLASVSGWLFAHFQRTVNPSPFGLNMGIEYLFMAVLGGVGHVWGALVGAGVVKMLEDQLQVLLPKLIGTQRQLRDHRLRRRCSCWCCSTRATASGPSSRRALPRAAAQGRLGRRAAAARARRSRRTARWCSTCSAVRKEFGGLVAVNDVSFQVRAGEILGLIGPNGAGKSTTFNLVTGVLPATRGEVALRGERIDGAAVARDRAARRLAHLPAREDDRRHDGARERRARRAPARPRAACRAAMLRLDRAEERRLLREAERQLRAHRHGASRCTSWPATSRSARSA